MTSARRPAARTGAWEWPPLRVGRFDEEWLVRLPGPALGLLVSVALFLSALTVTWVDATSTDAGFWPPSGVAFVALLVLPVRRWGWVIGPIVVIGLMGVLTSSYPFVAAAIWAVGNSVEPVIGASLMRWQRRRGVLSLARLLGRFVLYAVLLGPAVGGAIGAIGSTIAYDTSWFREALEWTVGDGLGVLIVTPLVFGRTADMRRPLVELVPFAVAVAAVSALAFTELGPGRGATVPYLIFVVLVAGAMRFGVRPIAVAAFVIAEAINVAMANDRGPFSERIDGADTALSLQVFLAIAIVTSFIVGALVSDLAGRDEVQRLLTQQATRDALTGLPNRIRFSEYLDEQLERTRATGEPFGVVMIDLDHFKKVNDRFGHPTGDQVLLIVAALFERVRAPDDFLARLGGDEFVLLCRGADGERLRERAVALLDTLAGTHQIGARRVPLSASAGVAEARGPDDSSVELMRRADIALYRSKRTSKVAVTLFGDELEAETRRRGELEDELRGAIARGELRLEYQPIVEVRTGRIAHFEALLRWDNRAVGRVGPDEFIPLAEENGSIAAIGEWVLRTACAQVAEWRRQRSLDLRVAVNVSARQLGDREFTATVTNALDALGFPADALAIEITETAMMDDVSASSVVLHELAALGVRLSLDDFGTGYSSMAYLRQFPLDSLKIDRSFLTGLAVSPEDLAIVESVVSLSRSFGLDVIAEGVETAEQRSRLIELGCGHGQGYFWYRPLRPEAVAELPDAAFVKRVPTSRV